MEKTTLITKYDINGEPLYVKVTNKPNAIDLFSIKIYEEDNSWSGRFSHELAEENRERVDETEEQYYENVMKGLSKTPDFICDFIVNSDDHNSATFLWKKKYRSAVLIHGSVPVYRDEVTESKDTLVDFITHENQEYRNTIESVMSRNKEIELDIDRCRISLDKIGYMSTELENNLYHDFIKVLNAKKRRILELEDSVYNNTN